MFFVFLLACSAPEGAPPEPSTTAWLNGSLEERFTETERQFRGMDVAMVEVGYRYSELAFAGADQNWPFATYQLSKIRKSTRLGLTRRPKRAASAKMFEPPLAGVEAAINAKDPAAFSKALDELTIVCNTCHEAEKVGFMKVVKPTERRSPIHGP